MKEFKLDMLESQRYLGNKVPNVTLVFWSIKMMSTTVGETAADFLIFKLHFGLIVTTSIALAWLILALYVQIQQSRYVPWIYWASVVLISIFGTLVTDTMTDHIQVPLQLSSVFFALALAAVFINWFKREHSLSIREINTPQREAYYWVAILFTFALGTAVGDWVSESIGLGYLKSALLFGSLLFAVGVAWKTYKVNTVTCFWLAYILTRPFGASCGDLLSKSVKHGGLGMGNTLTSAVFLLVIVALVAYLQKQESSGEEKQL